MAGTRQKRTLDPPTYRTHPGLPRSPYADHLARTAQQNAARRAKKNA